MDYLPAELLNGVFNNLKDKNRNIFSQVNSYLRSIFLIDGYNTVTIRKEEDLVFF